MKISLIYCNLYYTIFVAWYANIVHMWLYSYYSAYNIPKQGKACQLLQRLEKIPRVRSHSAGLCSLFFGIVRWEEWQVLKVSWTNPRLSHPILSSWFWLPYPILFYVPFPLLTFYPLYHFILSSFMNPGLTFFLIHSSVYSFIPVVSLSLLWNNFLYLMSNFPTSLWMADTQR